MKEFIDKLIGRLEELKTEALDKWDGGASHRAYSKAIDIANELAEEYKDKDCSKCSKRLWYQKGYADAEKEYKVGWIPCSERLPKSNGWYLVTNVLGVVQQQYWGASHWQKLRDEAVIAWMPLPEAYKQTNERSE